MLFLCKDNSYCQQYNFHFRDLHDAFNKISLFRLYCVDMLGSVKYIILIVWLQNNKKKGIFLVTALAEVSLSRRPFFE